MSCEQYQQGLVRLQTTVLREDSKDYEMAGVLARQLRRECDQGAGDRSNGRLLEHKGLAYRFLSRNGIQVSPPELPENSR